MQAILEEQIITHSRPNEHGTCVPQTTKYPQSNCDSQKLKQQRVTVHSK